MHFLRLLFLITTLAAIGGVAAQPPTDAKIVMTSIKYEGLKQEVLKHRGKVVVVDFWATYCPPCIAALPHYVEMQHKFADKGLVIITVSVDPTDKPKRVERAKDILTENNVALRNFILDEPYDMWTGKFDFKSLPFAYIFDRRGKWVRYRAADDPEGYNRDVEKTIMQMLNEK